MNNKFKIFFTCNVCGLPMADFVELDTKFWDENGINRITGVKWDADYVDFRHTACAEDHGNFRDMVSEYVEKTKESPAEAELFVQANRKRAEFDTELAKKVDKLKQKNDIINT